MSSRTGDGAESQRKGNGPSDAELARATPSATGGREVRIGVFVLAGTVAVILLLFLLTDPATFRGRYMITTELTDAGGVRSGDPVQMRGVNIGRVRSFEMRPPGVAIQLEINGQWQIPADSRVRLAGVGLLGGRTVEIVPGASEEPLPEGGTLPGESADGLMELADSLGDDAVVIAQRVRALLADTTVTQLQSSASELDRFLLTLSEAATEQREELQRLSSTLSSSAERVDDALARGELERALARTDSTLATLQDASVRLDRASASLEVVLRRLEDGEGTAGQLSTNDELYNNLNAAAEAILNLAEDVQENPSRYIRLRLF
jgi:phospholipid/cholesterol/gamma-HCH transport system substrate-binding protein